MTKEMEKMNKEIKFDLQLFVATGSEVYVATSSNEIVTVKKDGATAKKGVSGTPYNLTPNTEGAFYGGVDAGSGKDTITVESDTTSHPAHLSIAGGRGNDSISIQSDTHYIGNYFIYNSGDGQDKIKGWTESDTLIVDTKDYQTSMSADGNHFYVKIGSGFVDFEGLKQGTSTVNISVAGSANSETVLVKRLMQGTTKSETMYNLHTKTTFHGGTSTQTAWTIDAGAGNDKIQNDQNYVSIYGGTGNDNIYVKAIKDATTDTTTGVTIHGGAGNDTINVLDDTYTTNTGVVYGAHVYVFGMEDGKDTILGYSGNDSIVFENLNGKTITGNVDTSGNYIISVGDTKITLKKPSDRSLGGEQITVLEKNADGTLSDITNTVADFTPVVIDDSGTTVYQIPKKFLLTTASNSATYNAGTHDNYTIDAAAGNDNLKILGAKGVSVFGGAGNDKISVTGGTNLTDTAAVASSAYISGATVTIRGGAGNDYIYASLDSQTVTIAGTDTTVYASHVYEMTSSDGRDTIVGFNENDTIRIKDVTAANKISGDFDSTGKYFVVKVGDASMYLQLSDYFKGGKELHIVDGSDNAIALDATKGFRKVYYEDSDCTVATTDTTASYSKYFVPQKLMGTNGADGLSLLTNIDDDFVVEGLKGNDVIENIAASNVYIDGGAGNDVIFLSSSATTIAGTATKIYGAAVSVYGGAGNDTIYAEMIQSDTTGAVQISQKGSLKYIADEDSKKYRVYMFNYLDGEDTIYFMGDKDTIALDDKTVLVSTVVKDKDVVLNIGSKSDPKTTTGKITLKNYANDIDKSYVLGFYSTTGVGTTSYVTKPMYLPKEVIGTTGNDGLNNYKENYTIQAYAGNDTIRNYEGTYNVETQMTDTGAGSSIYAGAGNDSIRNEVDNVYIDAGAGNDKVLVMFGGANTIRVGQGDDTIFAGEGGGQTYIFKADEGKNYIYGLTAGDTIKFEGVYSETLTSETTMEGVVFTIGTGSQATKVIVKGALKENAASETYNANTDNTLWATYHDNPNNYLALTGEDKIKYQVLSADGVNYDNKVANVAKVIIGTNDHDKGAKELVATSDMEGYTIEAKAGNDFIKSLAKDVTINAGIGDDTIQLVDSLVEVTDSAVSNTVYGGRGNDSIYSSGNANVFKYANGDGNDTIEGFGEYDTLEITGGVAYTTSMTADGFKVIVGEGSILIKSNDYVKGGAILNITDGTQTTTTVIAEAYGTNSADNITVNSDFEDYHVYALNGNDIITVSETAVKATVDAGSGNDTINIQGGTGIVIVPNFGNDVINAKYGAEEGRLFVFNSVNQGENIINGLNADDTIQINFNDYTGKAASIKSAEFVDGYFVLSLSDNKTTIKIKEIDGTDATTSETTYQSIGRNVKTFNLLIGALNEDSTSASFNIPTEYKVPSIQHINDTNTHVFSDTTYKEYIFIGDDKANQITIGSNTKAVDNVSIYGGKGNDIIKIASGATATITAGEGNDRIELLTTEHLINYAYGDGDDTIVGWSAEDTLNVSGFDNLSTVMTGSTFAIKLGNNYITFEGAAPGDSIAISGFPDTFTSSLDGITYDGNTGLVTVVIPKLIQGDSSANTFTNTGSFYKVMGMSGNDNITNANGDNVTIDGGAGNDLITIQDGDNLSVLGDSENDTIYLEKTETSTIDGGYGHDLISISAAPEGNTIRGGGGNDTIFGNNVGNTFIYKLGDGNDTIYGFNALDTLIIEDVGVKTLGTTGTDAKTASVTTTDKGLVITFNDSAKSTLTLKGQKFADKVDSDTAATDFKFLTKNDSFTITTKNTTTGDTDTIAVNIVNEQIVTKGQEFVNEEGNNDIKIKGTAAADTIKNFADNVSINGGKEKDWIYNDGDNVTITGGAGADRIFIGKSLTYNTDATVTEGTEPVGNATKVTINAGKGNDTIWGNSNGNEVAADAHVYQFAVGDGSDVIHNFGWNDKISLDGSKYDYEILNTTHWIEDPDHAGQYIEVDDPEHKDVVIKVGTATTDKITLKNLDIDQVITFENITVSGKSQLTLTVPRRHQISSTEATSENNVFGNTVEAYEIIGTTDKNFISNAGDKVTITADEGELKNITNIGKNAKIKTGNANDVIVNEGLNSSINAGNGDNQITNSAIGATITAGSGIDIINNSGAGVVINSGAGNDVINNSDSAVINAGAGEDVINNYHEGATINAGDDDDIINLDNSQDVVVEAGKGNDTINSSNTGSRIYKYKSGDGYDVISHWSDSDEIRLTLGNGETYETQSSSAGYTINIVKGSGADSQVGSINITSDIISGKTQPMRGNVAIKISQDDGVSYDYLYTPNIIYVADTETTITNTDYEYTVLDENGTANIITNKGQYNTISAGAKDDKIFNTADNVSINGGAGDDSIILAETLTDSSTNVEYVTVRGGTGDDSILADVSSTRTHSVIYEYDLGDGNDTIVGFNENDIIQIKNGTVTTQITTDTGTFIINVQNEDTVGSIRLDGYAAGQQVHIAKWEYDDEEEEYAFIEDDEETVVPHLIKVSNTHVVTATETYVLVLGTNLADTINYGNSESEGHVSINAGAGNDSIIIQEDVPDVHIFAGKGSDTIKVVTSHNNGIVYHFADGDGYNTIINFNPKDTIKFEGTYADYKVSSELISISGGNAIKLSFDSNTTVVLNGVGGGKEVNIEYSDGNTETVTFNTNFIAGSERADNISNDGNGVQILSYANNDTIANTGSDVTIDAGTGNDSINNEGDNVSIVSGEGADEVLNEGNNVTIDSGEGNDTIYYSGQYGTVDAGADDDTINLDENSGSSTVIISAGNDTINNNDNGTTAGQGHLYVLDKTDDGTVAESVVINGFATNDSIKINYDATVGEIVNTSAFVDGYFVFTVGDTQISLKAEKGAAQGEHITVLDSTGAVYKENGTVRNIVVPRIYGTAITSTAINIRSKYSDERSDTDVASSSNTDPTGYRFLNGTYVYASSRNDTIQNYQPDVTINAAGGTDVITNSGERTSISAGAGDDTITNEANNVTINVGAGNDSIFNNTASDATIIYELSSSNTGANTIKGWTSNSTLVYDNLGSTRYTAPANTAAIMNSAYTQVTLTTNDGNSVVIQALDGQTFKNNIPSFKLKLGGASNDTMSVAVGTIQLTSGSSNRHTINAGEANSDVVVGGDLFTADLEGYRYNLSSGRDSITVTGSNNYIVSGNDAKLITITTTSVVGSTSTAVTVVGGSAADTITNKSAYTSINAGAQNDSIINEGAHASLYGGAGDDSFYNTAAYVYINGDAGNDYISNTGVNTSIFAGAGDDTIINSASDVTIVGDKGSASITNDPAKAITYYVTSNAGTATIKGWNDSSTILYASLTADQAATARATMSADYKRISLNGGDDRTVVFVTDSNFTDTAPTFTLKYGPSTAYSETTVKAGVLNLTSGNAAYTDTSYAGSTTYGTGGDRVKFNNAVFNGMTISAGTGNDSITIGQSSKKISLGSSTVTSNNEKNFIIESATVDSSEAVTVVTGGDADYINNKRGYTYIRSGANADHVTNSGASARISLEAGDDFMTNTGVSASIDAGAGADYIYNSSDGTTASIFGGAGNDTIYNAANNVTIVGGTDNDSIYNTATGAVTYYVERNAGTATIKGWTNNGVIQYASLTAAQAANARATMSADYKRITLNNGNDQLIVFETDDTFTETNLTFTLKYGTGSAAATKALSVDVLNLTSGNNTSPYTDSTTDPATYGMGGDKVTFNNEVFSNMTINAGTGNDSVTIGAASSKIYLGSSTVTANNSKHFTINSATVNSSTAVTVSTGGDADYIHNQRNYTSISAGAGNDHVTNTGANAYVILGAGNDYMSNTTGASVTINAGDGDDNIYNTANLARISLGAGNDYIYNNGGSSDTVYAGAGNDEVYNKGGYALVSLDAGDDAMTNTGTKATIYGDAGTDYIYNSSTGTNSSIFGGADNDTIYNEANGVTIVGGADDDRIYNTATGAVTYYVERNAGTATIKGWTNNGVIQYASLTAAQAATARASMSADYKRITLNGGNDRLIVFETDDTFTATNKNLTFKLAYGTGGATTETLTASVLNLTSGNDHEHTIGTGATSSTTVGGDLVTLGTFFDNYTINANSGKDSITVQARNAYIGASGAASLGAKHINITSSVADAASAVTVLASSADDYITNTSTFASISAGAGADHVTNSGNNAYIALGDGDDFMTNTGVYVTINGGNGADYIYNNTGGSETSILGGAGADSIINFDSKVSVYGGADNDSIKVSGGIKSYYAGDAGNDFFVIGAEVAASENANTIFGGAGNDSIKIEKHGNVFYYSGYNTNEGADTITGFDTSDTLYVNSTRTTLTDATAAGGRLLTVGSTTILFQGKAADDTIKVQIGSTLGTYTFGGSFVSESTVTRVSGRVAEDYSFVNSDIFEDEDDFYTTDNTSNLSSIMDVGTSNYSAGDIEDFNYDTIANGNVSLGGYDGQGNKQKQ